MHHPQFSLPLQKRLEGKDCRDILLQKNNTFILKICKSTIHCNYNTHKVSYKLKLEMCPQCEVFSLPSCLE